MSPNIYEEDYKRIIARLRKARIDAGITQMAAAKSLGKPQSYISKIECGERRLDVIELKKLGELYKKPTSFFFLHG
jgi:transcriptional regulator with XRE-family HTH domain